MLFELKAGREINLEFIVSMNKHSEHYEICLAGGHKYHIPESKYLEIKKYFDAKNLKGVFVSGEKKEDVPVVNLPFITSKPFADLKVNMDNFNILNHGWETLKPEEIKMILPLAHDNKYSGRLLDHEEIKKRNKDVVDSIVSAVKPEKDYLSDVMEKIRQENADCKKCANAKIECNTCLVYHGGKHHFTNLKVTAESVNKADREKIAFHAEPKEASAIRGVLEMLKMEGVIKAYSFYEINDFTARFTITKG